MTWARRAPTGALLEVRVTPNAPRWSLTADAAGLHLRVDAAPVDGEANARVVAVIAREILHLPRSAVVLLRGERSRRKTLAIALTPEQLDARIRACLDG